MPAPHDRHIDPDEFIGDTSALKRRLGRQDEIRRAWPIIVAAGIIGAGLYFGIKSLKPSFYVTGSPGEIMFLNARSGRAGACQVEGERVRCLETDWSAGPLRTGE